MSLKCNWHLFGAFALAITVARSARAQDTVAAPPPPPAKEVTAKSFVKNTNHYVNQLFRHQLHPIAKGVASGGGPGIGLGYDAPLRKPWEMDADALVTMKKYWSITAIAGYHASRFEVEGYGRTRDMLSLSYFGPGNETSNDDRSDFRLRDKVAGGQAGVDVLPWLRVNGRVERYWPEVFSGRDTRLPNLEDQFSTNIPVGFTEQPTYWRYQTSAEISFNPGEGESLQQGTRLRGTYTYNKDNDLDTYSFAMTDVEFQQRFALFRPHNRLTLHALASSATAKDGQTIPFYMLRTLGGKGNLRTVHEYLIGTDGTDATLRGYSSFRYRDRNVLLFQAEYRFPIKGPVEATLFADAGRVASDRSDLFKLSGLHPDYGASISIMRGMKTLFRTDLAFSSEGVRALLTLGKDITP